MLHDYCEVISDFL